MASIPSNYAVNISKRDNSGRMVHHSLVELGQITQNQAVEKLNELRAVFGNEYNYELTYWECIGHIVYSDYFKIDKTRG